MDSKKQRQILILNLALAVLIVSIIMLVIEVTGASGFSYNNTGEGIDLFGSVYKHVLNNYVTEVNPDEIAKNAVEGILENLDPYSDFLPPIDFSQLEEDTRGEFYGLGIEIATRKKYPQVMSHPLPGSPAERVGLRAGDKIVRIDGVSTLDMDINEVVSRLRGKLNTKVTIHVSRGGRDDLLEFTITRAKITLTNISWSGEIEEGIGYIKLDRFNQGAPREMDEALLNLLKNENLKGVILDLRGNPGGLLTAALDIANKFLPRGSMIVFTLGRDPKSKEEYEARKTPILYPTPIVVLVNRASASASEIVAGSIQDHDRGVLIGETTFGKGSVQTVYEDLPKNAGIKLTTAHYYTPSGRLIHNEHNLDMDYINMQMGEEESIDSETGVEDSLAVRDKFYTLNKQRVVYAGGGVTPDIIVREERIGNIVVQLRSQSMFFNFAVQYTETHPELTKDFEISEALIEEFKAYISDTDAFTYSIPGKSNLDDFRKIVTREKYNGDIVEMIDNLEKALLAKRDKDFEANIEIIKRILKREIVSAEFGPTERTIASKDRDKQLQKAIEILDDPEQYNSILEVGAKTGIVAKSHAR